MNALRFTCRFLETRIVRRLSGSLSKTLKRDASSQAAADLNRTFLAIQTTNVRLEPLGNIAAPRYDGRDALKPDCERDRVSVFPFLAAHVAQHCEDP